MRLKACRISDNARSHSLADVDRSSSKRSPEETFGAKSFRADFHGQRGQGSTLVQIRQLAGNSKKFKLSQQPWTKITILLHNIELRPP